MAADSSFSGRARRSARIVAGRLRSLLLALIYTPWGQRLFATAPPGLDVWLYMLPFALAIGVAEEARKRLVSAFCRRE
jgi:hypothetical protein